MRWHKAGYNKLAKEVTRYYSAPPATAELRYDGKSFTLHVYSGTGSYPDGEYYFFGSNYQGDWTKARRYANRLLHKEHWY